MQIVGLGTRRGSGSRRVLSDQLGIRQCCAYHQGRNYHSEHTLRFAIVPAELELIEVAMEMFYRHLMEAPYDAALEQAPVAINCAGVNVAANPLFRGVIDYLMFLHVGRHPFVKLALIGVYRIRGDRDVVFDFVDNIEAIYCGDVICLRLAATGHDPEYRLLIVLRTLATLVVFLCSDVGFVGLYSSREGLGIGNFDQSHCLSDAVIQIPRSLIGALQIALHLESADPLLRVDHDGDRQQPFFQIEVGVVEYGSGSNGKLPIELANTQACQLDW